MRTFINKDKFKYYLFLWHASFLALTMSMIDFNTVFPALVNQLTERKIIFGLLYGILLGAPKIFNIIFSHFLNNKVYKKKYLVFGILVRAFSFLGMAIFTYSFGEKYPNIVILSFFIFIFTFSISGGFAGISYADIIGKLFTSRERGNLYSTKEFLSAIFAFIGGVLITKIFAFKSLVFPLNYSIILFVGFVGLIIASVGFLLIDEPASPIEKQNISLKVYIQQIPIILKKDPSFTKFIIIENLTSFSQMALPFYIVYANDVFVLSADFIGKFLLFQIAGKILSNIFWGYLFKRYNSKRVNELCILFGAFIPIIAILLSYTKPYYFSFLFFLIGFIISGRRIGFETYLLDIIPEKSRTMYLGIRGSLNIFVAIIPILGGIFIDSFGYNTTFIIVSAIMLTSFYVFYKNK
jgi:MFS family permease